MFLTLEVLGIVNLGKVNIYEGRVQSETMPEISKK